MSDRGPSPHATSVPSASRRAVILVLAGLLAVHSFLVLMWVMPSNPFRDAVGDDRVSSYINNDYLSFEQSWSIFAPVPRRAGENVVVRARLRGADGEPGRVTEWYDITGNEDKRITHLINPSRIHSATRRLGGDINATSAEYNATQRSVPARDFSRSAGGQLKRDLIKAGSAGAAGRKNIDAYLLTEGMLVRFGTMYATARWGDDVAAVEFKVGHRSVPAFADRHKTQLSDIPFTYYRIGWRRAMPGNADAQAAFDAYVRKAATTSASPKAGE